MTHILPLGIVDVLLEFLSMCEGPFDAVELSINPKQRIFTPSHWVNLLNTMTKIGLGNGKYNMHIVENIGPLIKCMCNTKQRQLFESKAQVSTLFHAYDMVLLFQNELIFSLIPIWHSGQTGQQFMALALTLVHSGMVHSIRL
jgi:hypothetical protein